METKRFVVPEGTYCISANMIGCIREGDIFEEDFQVKTVEIPKDVTEIVLPDSVEAIYEYAFDGCSTLVQINIPESVTKIGDHAFWGCSSLTRISIPNSVTKISEYAFCICSSLTRIDIPNSVTEICDFAFEYCSSLTKIDIPDSATKISRVAFLGCSSLAAINVSAGNPVFHDMDGVLFEGSVLRIFPPGKTLQRYSVPDFVTEIGEWAFQDCISLGQIDIPDSVTEIGIRAFLGCHSLAAIKVSPKNPVFHDEDGVLFRESVLLCFPNRKNERTYDIPDHVKEIADCAFRDCCLLTKINIPDSVTKIGSSAFEGCSSLTEIDIPNSITEIKFYAFRNCPSLMEIKIPDSVSLISLGAFRGCSSLEEINIPNSVTKIYSAFDDCFSLAAIKVSAGNPVFHDEDGVLFEGTVLRIFPPGKTLRMYRIPGFVTKIGSWSFNDCASLTRIDIPDSVTEIGHWVFNACTSLTEIDIPDSVTKIGDDAFSGCHSLAEIKVSPKNPIFHDENGVLFKGTVLWRFPVGKNVQSSYDIPDSVTEIGDSAFKGCSSLMEIKIPDSVEKIGKEAFEHCSSLTSIWIPASVKKVGKGAFSGCSSLKTVHAPGHLSFDLSTSRAEVPNSTEIIFHFED